MKPDIDDVSALAKAGAQIRQWIIDTPFQSELENAIRDAYDLLSADDAEASFAVRSSATAEDMPDASFAGQQETFLNVQGFDAVLVAVKHVFASLFNDRAISYRVHQGYDHRGVALSRRGAGGWSAPILPPPASCSPSIPNPALTRWCLSPRRGVWARWLVQGAVNPDEFYVHKPTLAAGRPAIRAPHHGVEKDPYGLRADPGAR
ncbi:phosphoenolpyruvate synthase [Klebsiella pneumoniae subsp. rhinoscleromatis]|nr:phosphoenolpyruvate synthase [Klebsiella pneumoniae subsp. rhinoscleromatis]